MFFTRVDLYPAIDLAKSEKGRGVPFGGFFAIRIKWKVGKKHNWVVEFCIPQAGKQTTSSTRKKERKKAINLF